MSINLAVRHHISVRHLTRADVERMFRLATALEALPVAARREILEGRVVALAFYQPSTRTRSAFESGVLRLGGGVTGFADVRTTRAGDYYQESLEDVILNLAALTDGVVLRHHESGAAARAAAVSPVPVVNAGDGYNEHPSQGLGDVWTMHRALGGLEGRTIGLLGNPSIRSLHSISILLAQFPVRRVVYLPAPRTSVPEDVTQLFAAQGVDWDLVTSSAELVQACDLVETIGVNHPNHNASHQAAEGEPPQGTEEHYRVTASILRQHGPGTVILHPGPRTDELSTDVDALPEAFYLPQVTWGMWMKAAMVVDCLVPETASLLADAAL